MFSAAIVTGGYQVKDLYYLKYYAGEPDMKNEFITKIQIPTPWKNIEGLGKED